MVYAVGFERHLAESERGLLANHVLDTYALPDIRRAQRLGLVKMRKVCAKDEAEAYRA